MLQYHACLKEVKYVTTKILWNNLINKCDGIVARFFLSVLAGCQSMPEVQNQTNWTFQLACQSWANFEAVSLKIISVQKCNTTVKSIVNSMKYDIQKQVIWLPNYMLKVLLIMPQYRKLTRTLSTCESSLQNFQSFFYYVLVCPF